MANGNPTASQAIAAKPNGTLQESQTAAELLERVLIGGDLSKLSTPERLHYYKAICASTGLNPLTKPFEYITLSGKLTLYARKDATDQLRSLKGISVVSAEGQLVEGIYIVTTHVKNAEGRTDVATGAVPIDNLKGEARANAMMKAETKSKRRATLSICGLGMLDETEVESIAPEPPPERTVPTESIPLVGGRRANTGAELVAHVEKIGDYYEVTDHDEVFEVRKDNGAVVCSCGADGKDSCQHRLAVRMWVAQQQPATPAQPATVDAEPEPSEAHEAADEPTNAPMQITKSQLISLCEITKQLEDAGVDEDTWREQLEKITGSRSRKGIMQDELAKVMFAFNNALAAQQRKGKRKINA